MTDLKTQMQSDLNKMYDHLIEQGRASTRKRTGCAYRGDDNTMCAVGCLISDEAYNPEMENLRAQQVADWYPSAFPFLWDYEAGKKAKYKRFLDNAQDQMHDRISEDANFAAQVLDGYEYLAHIYDLKVERGQ